MSTITSSAPINIPAPNRIRDRFDARPFYLKPMVVSSKEARLEATIEEQQYQMQSLMQEVARLTHATNSLVADNRSLAAANYTLSATNRALTAANNKLTADAAARHTVVAAAAEEKAQNTTTRFVMPTPPSSPTFPPGLPLPRMTPPTSPVAVAATRPKLMINTKMVHISTKDNSIMLPKLKARPSPPTFTGAPMPTRWVVKKSPVTQLATPPTSTIVHHVLPTPISSSPQSTVG